MTATLSSPALAQAAPAVAGDFFVAPGGRDDNAGTIERPFATLERARDAVRALPKDRDVVVVVRGGTYRLQRTLVLGPEDSGSPRGRVIYQAYPGEAPVLSSARSITGWKREADGKLWSADVSRGWLFHQLFVDGRPQPRARRPDNDDWQTWPTITAIGKPESAGQLVTFPRGTLDGVSGAGDVEVCFLPSYRWMNQLFVLRDVDAGKDIARRHSRNVTYVGAAGDPFRIENALVALTKPGQWCVDAHAGRVYYWPPDGTTMDGAQVTAPTMSELVRFQGDEASSRIVHHVELRGLTFTCSDRPPEDAWPREWLKRNFECPEAALFMQGMEDCAVADCRFEYLGGYAVALNQHAQRVRVIGNEMAHLGCGGIQIYGHGPGTSDVNHGHVIERNHIHHIGESYWHAAGVSIYGSGRNRIALNYLHDLPYVGIIVAGAFVDAFNAPPHNTDAYGENEALFHFRRSELPAPGTFTRASVKQYQHSADNVVEQNIVFDSMQTLIDGGALYAFSCGTGNVWRRNVVRDPKPTKYLFPLYMDDEVDGATIEGNAVWSPGQIMNKGDNRWTDNTVSPQRTPQYDQLLSEIRHEAEARGGWLQR